MLVTDNSDFISLPLHNVTFTLSLKMFRQLIYIRSGIKSSYTQSLKVKYIIDTEKHKYMSVEIYKIQYIVYKQYFPIVALHTQSSNFGILFYNLALT